MMNSFQDNYDSHSNENLRYCSIHRFMEMHTHAIIRVYIFPVHDPFPFQDTFFYLGLLGLGSMYELSSQHLDSYLKHLTFSLKGFYYL